MKTTIHINRIIDLFVALYKSKHGRLPILNRQKAYFPIKDLVEEYSFDKVKAMVEYYFKVSDSYSMKDFVDSYHIILEQMEESKDDIRYRNHALEATRRRVEEYLNDLRS